MKKLVLALILPFSFALNAFAVVNLNTATQEQLKTLNVVGPAKAQAIIEYRKKNGNFKMLPTPERLRLHNVVLTISPSATAPSATCRKSRTTTARTTRRLCPSFVVGLGEVQVSHPRH